MKTKILMGVLILVIIGIAGTLLLLKSEFRKVERHEEFFTLATATECEKYWPECKEFCAKPENLETCLGFCKENARLWKLVPLENLTLEAPAGEIEYYKGFMVPLQGGRNLDEVLSEIWKAKQVGVNLISIHPEYELGENNRPTLSPLWEEEERPDENWRHNLVVMINYAHLLGLRVEIKNAEVWGKNDVEWDNLKDEEKPTPEDYIAGYLDATKELAEIAEAYHVYQFCLWSEVDHIVMQGKYGTIDLDNVQVRGLEKDFENTISDWSQRMLSAIKERFNGKIGVGFSGMLDNLASHQNALKGFDFIEFSFYGDVFEDYVTNTPANALKTIEEYRKLAQRNEINTLLIGEMGLEELISRKGLSSTERQQIYHKFFEAAYDKLDGYILNSIVSYYNYDEDMKLVAKEWYGKLPLGK